MISIVICSVKKELAEQLKRNVGNTIGVPWETVIIDNSKTPRSITQVYNEGVQKAIFPIICFAHEDIEFLTYEWGKKILEHFETDSSLGLIGLAGSAYKSRTLSGWMTGISIFDHCNITHLDSRNNRIKMLLGQSPSAAIKEVVTLDGVLLCARKSIMLEIPFDSSLPGFHLYDIDISYRVSRRYKAAVTYEVDIVHYTEGGDFGNNWVDSTIRWHEKYRNRLPVFIGGKVDLQSAEETRIPRFWLKRLGMENISFSNKMRWIRFSGTWKKIGLWPYIGMFFCLKFIKPLTRRLIKRKQKI